MKMIFFVLPCDFVFDPGAHPTTVVEAIVPPTVAITPKFRKSLRFISCLIYCALNLFSGVKCICLVEDKFIRKIDLWTVVVLIYG
jgi:hypothetical protein